MSVSKEHKVTHSYSVFYTIDKWFPPPRLLIPTAAGIDISDTSIKWIVLEERGSQHVVRSYGSEPLESGIVTNGIINDVVALGKALTEIRKHLGNVSAAHAALPEEAAFVFDMQIPAGSDRDQALRMIEFELEGRVPISPDGAIYDYDVIHEAAGDTNSEIGVVVFPKDLAEKYATAFELAGIQLISLELEARSIARAVSPAGEEKSVMLMVDFGRNRSGFAIIKNGVPIFTSTVEVGSEKLTRLLMDKRSLSREEAELFKNDQGLIAQDTKSEEFDIMHKMAAALADEIERHYRYWDTRRDEKGERMSPVERILLMGGSANLKGLTDFISGRVQAPTDRADVWQHVCSFDDYIPPIDRRTSLQYATAIGLALRAI